MCSCRVIKITRRETRDFISCVLLVLLEFGRRRGVVEPFRFIIDGGLVLVPGGIRNRPFVFSWPGTAGSAVILAHTFFCSKHRGIENAHKGFGMSLFGILAGLYLLRII